MRIEESIEIERPATEVFAFLADRANDPRWMVAVTESEWLDASEQFDVGRRGRMVMNTLGRRATYVDEVTEYVPGRRIAHRVVEGPLPLETACVCEPTGGGSCRATVVGETERLPGGRFGTVLSPVVRRVIRRGFRADLARLKELMEQHNADHASRAPRDETVEPKAR